MSPTESEKSWRIPGMPAWPQNSAQKDQPKAARVPSETRVSMVAAPCRRLVQAARWNGRPPWTTTGPVRAKASHCQLVNCRAGTIDSMTTGMLRTALISRRSSRGSAAGCSAAVAGPDGSTPDSAGTVGAGGGGSSAV